MKYDTYLEFIYTLIDKNLIEEKFYIKKSNYLGERLGAKDFEKVNRKVEKVVVEVKLENNFKLLIEDFYLNFLLSYTILVGDKVKLISFSINNENYICAENLFDVLKLSEKFSKYSNKKRINPLELKNKKYFRLFAETQVIEEVRNYTKEVRGIDLNKIHIVDDEKIENFCPNFKHSHLKLSNKLNLPLIRFIENNFIIDTNINILDKQKCENIIKPVFKFEKEELVEIDKKYKKRVIRSLDKEVFLNYDVDLLCEKIENCNFVNFNKDEIIKQILTKPKIFLTSRKSKIPFPLYKEREFKFLKIKNEKEFLELTGVKFSLNEKKLEKIFTLSLDGKPCRYQKYRLNSLYENVILNLKKEKDIKFYNLKELILKLCYIDDFEKLVFVERINENWVQEILKILKKLIKKVILLSIDENKIPYNNLSKTKLGSFYQSCANSLYLELENFRNVNSKKILLKNSLKISNNLLQTFKQQKTSIEEAFFICQNILILIKILFIFDEKNTLRLKKLFKSYFKDTKFNVYKSKVDVDIEKAFRDISITNNLSLKNRVYVILKKDIDKKYFYKGVMFESEDFFKYDVINKPNFKKIKGVFPYSYKKIIEMIRKNRDKTEFNIEIKGKVINISSKYYKSFKKYVGFKCVCENDYFLTLVKI